MRLSIAGVTAGWTSVPAVNGIDLTVEAGAFVALVGPNGSGKSTMLKTVYRALRPRAGSILLGPDDLWRAPARQVARAVGVLAQDQHGGFDFTARESVGLGRTPYLGMFDRLQESDWTVVDQALDRTGCGPFADRRLSTLSGGERQRVLLARALAQQPRLLVLDEPTNHLDPFHQLDVLELVRSLNLTVLAALHSLDLAAAYADTLVALRAGRVVAAGPPAVVLGAEVLRDVFDIDGFLLADPFTGRPRLIGRPRCVCPQRPCLWSCHGRRPAPAAGSVPTEAGRAAGREEAGRESEEKRNPC
ncbi:ferric enterobactin transport protein (ABC superfamily, atp_bind) [Frankia alni ACN14a]|uniref:Ferric enterobactin transport protein (ABC superfamily, atp_bind) n=1 Tax=Frankia alni (strain DSM 45986 / CECT 9034 / ACN14a) TaxID=326424 RepID=Q0RE34_FRAAA|nr:ferric enterobactin transport protein (ABC superfamily, atp_bind) [Frankia alni ACN14a]